MQKNLSQWLAGVALAGFVSLATLAQTTAMTGPKDGANLPPADLTRLKLGEAAPDFTLLNQDGQAVTLSSYRGKQPVVLVFYRGYW